MRVSRHVSTSRFRQNTVSSSTCSKKRIPKTAFLTMSNAVFSLQDRPSRTLAARLFCIHGSVHSSKNLNVKHSASHVQLFSLLSKKAAKKAQNMWYSTIYIIIYVVLLSGLTQARSCLDVCNFRQSNSIKYNKLNLRWKCFTMILKWPI